MVGRVIKADTHPLSTDLAGINHNTLLSAWVCFTSTGPGTSTRQTDGHRHLYDHNHANDHTNSLSDADRVNYPDCYTNSAAYQHPYSNTNPN